MSKYSHLFSEGQIGSLTIRNRIIMAPMGTLLANADGQVSEHQIAYYAERAQGGTGLIITEIVAVEPELGKAVAVQTRGDEDQFIPGLSRLAAACQKYGARIFPQLHHAGNQSTSRICGGKQIVAPSAVTNKAIGEEPRALSTDEVRELVRKFIEAAVRCRIAGFDGVELHGAHGYLINQFTSPHSNRRDDAYGGSFENRMRFVTEIVQGIKRECGQDFPVMVRYSAEEFVEGGLTLEDGKQIARHLAQAGADALDVSCGTYESMPTLLEPITYDQGWRVYSAEAVKSVVDVPVVAVGVIRQPAFAEEVLAQGRADFIAIGRDLLTDPEWANKAQAGRDQDIRQCISCLYCVDRIFAPNHIACAVNARAGRETEFTGFPQDGLDRVVAIIGGGPAGMEAARMLSLRGFRPVVYEKRAELGGELVPGCRPPKKDEIGWYKDYLKHQMKKMVVDVRLGTEATPQLVEKENPYAVIVAIGAEPLVPTSIPGIPGERVITSKQALEESFSIPSGQKAVVVGGGLTGCEIADMLALQGATVSVVEMLPQIAPTANNINRLGIQARLEESKVTVLTQRKLTRVLDRAIEIEHAETGDKERLDADWVVLSLGLRPPEDEVKAWRNAFERVTVVGDAVSPRRVAEAVREGFDAAWTLV